MKRLTIGTALLVETLSPKNKVKCIVPQKRYFPTFTKALLRTHEFRSPAGKEPKAAGGEAAHGQVAECGLREFRASGSYYVKEGSTFRERQSQPEVETFTL